MESKPIRGWVLYDDSCGFCRRWIPFWSGTLHTRDFDIAPLQSDWVRERLNLPQDCLVRDLRLLLANDSQIEGADVYRYVMKHIWWAYPVFILAALPVFRQIFDFGYRTFARNRFRFSRACGLQRQSHKHNNVEPGLPCG